MESKPAAPATSAQTPATANLERLVNASYGKLHRGDERAYAGDLLKAMRSIFESGCAIPASELTIEKIREALNRAGANSTMSKNIIALYQECELICFSPTLDNQARERENDYARFNRARSIIFELIGFIKSDARSATQKR
jgi:hypothetical protein